MVHNIMYLFGMELMKDGHCYGAIGERGEESHGPLAGVASTEGNLITFHDAAVLEKNMQLLDLAGNIMILQRLTFEIGQCVAIPIIDDAFLDQ